MNVLITAYDKKLRGQAKDAARRGRKGAKLHVYKPVRIVPVRDRWDG